MGLQNLHTHSVWCDGADTLEELVLEAIRLGMDTIGFSSHSYTPFDTSCCMTDTDGYIAQCSALKSKYRGKINILCGVEADYYSDAASYQGKGFDFVIGSVHYLKCGEEYLPIDESAQILTEGAKKHFSSMAELVRQYYALEADVVRKTGCDIIGHFDLITKFCDVCPQIIDTCSQDYTSARDHALSALIKTGKIFEVNTGAMARGYRRLPYPDASCLRTIAERGGKVMITSDCHKKEQLCYGFETAKEILVSNGFKCVYLYNNGRFESTNIENI